MALLAKIISFIIFNIGHAFMHQMSLSASSPPYFFSQDLSLIWNSQVLLDWPARESAHPSLPSAGSQARPGHGRGDPDSAPHAPRKAV